VSLIDTLILQYRFNRTRTLGLLDTIEQLPTPNSILGWRPGPGRAHVAWQLLHIAVTEDLFACQRLVTDKSGCIPELWDRFRGGSTPDDTIPASWEIRQALSATRDSLLDTLSRFDDGRLAEVPPGLKERGLTLREALHVVSWHEAHHQGQAHLTLNLWRASQMP